MYKVVRSVPKSLLHAQDVYMQMNHSLYKVVSDNNKSKKITSKRSSALKKHSQPPDLESEGLQRSGRPMLRKLLQVLDARVTRRGNDIVAFFMNTPGHVVSAHNMNFVVRQGPLFTVDTLGRYGHIQFFPFAHEYQNSEPVSVPGDFVRIERFFRYFELFSPHAWMQSHIVLDPNSLASLLRSKRRAMAIKRMFDDVTHGMIGSHRLSDLPSWGGVGGKSRGSDSLTLFRL